MGEVASLEAMVSSLVVRSLCFVRMLLRVLVKEERSVRSTGIEVELETELVAKVREVRELNRLYSFTVTVSTVEVSVDSASWMAVRVGVMKDRRG